MSRSRPHTSRPLTSNANTPRRLPSATGAGDNLEEELITVLSKEYDEGETGKLEAIHDVKEVLLQVAQDPMAQQMDKLMPRFLAPSPKSGGPDDTAPTRAQTSRSKSKPGATPRHAKLTARPMTDSGRFGRKVPDERPSVPNMSQGDAYRDIMRVTASAPTLPEARYSTASSMTSISSASSSVRKSISSKPADTTTAEVLKGKHRHIPYHDSRGAESAISNSSVPGERNSTHDDQAKLEEEEMPFTENLLEITSDTEETDEIWKSDIVELTRIKSAPKGQSYTGPDSLELKYKDPIWPHQLFLNQILARHPSLTHLVLDGSELRFLRDLGSSLQSLLTLSICDCGLRSLDGIYGMPNLRTLIARKNMISIPTQLSFLRKLSYLDLSSNPISSVDEFGNLRHCGELRILKLYDTPLAISNPNFNKEIKRLVPQLKEIHPSRLYDLIGMPRLMVRSSKIASNDRKGRVVGGDHPKAGQNREKVGKHVGTAMADGGEDTHIKKEKTRRNELSMPSLAYDDVMVDQPKPGIAYQKIQTNKTLKELEQEHRLKESEIKDLSLGTGDFTRICMAPKFLQHLEETMQPSTSEEDIEENQEEKTKQKREPRQRRKHSQYTATGATAVNFHQDDKIDSTEILEGNVASRTVLKKKSDMGFYKQKEQEQQTATRKNHPMGDGNLDHL